MKCLLLLAATAAATAATAAAALDPAFGHHLRGDFTFASDYTNLNHGSYGSPAHAVNQALWATHHEMDLSPDLFLRRTLYARLNESREAVAALVNADPDDVVYVDNASDGVNTVLRSLPPGAVVLYLNTAYQMTKNAISHVVNVTSYLGDAAVEAKVPFPRPSNADIVGAVRAALDAHPEVTLLTFSHITSCPSLVLPAKELTALAHERGVAVLIDGAHAVGHVPIDVADIGADYYVSNCHKWLYSARGAAFLHVRKAAQASTFPTVISDEGQGNPFQKLFSWVGTRDYSPALTVPAAIEFRAQFGEAAITSYIHELAVAGGRAVAEAWGTELLNREDMIGAMVDVRLPNGTDPSVVDWLPTELLDRHNCYVPMYAMWPEYGGDVYARLSAQVYLEVEDFEWVAGVVLELLASSSDAGQ